MKENQKKENESDPEDADFTSLQNRKSAATGNMDEQDGAKKISRKRSRSESYDVREPSASTFEFEKSIFGSKSHLTKAEFCVDKSGNGRCKVSVVIPPASLEANIPLTDSYIQNNDRAPKVRVLKESEIGIHVGLNLQHEDSRDYANVKKIATEKKKSKSEKSYDKIIFQNLKNKIKGGRQSIKNIDSTLSKKDYGNYLEVRKCTWLPLNELPAPRHVPISVAFAQKFKPVMTIVAQLAYDITTSPQTLMRYEMLRFLTLRNYPKDNKPYVIKLAEAGFYYDTECDSVACFSCGVRKNNWVANDNPMKVHQQIKPDCKFLKKNEEVNVPVKYYGPCSEKLSYIMSIPEPIERPELSEDVNNDWAPEPIRSHTPAQQNRQNEIGTNYLGVNTGVNTVKPDYPQYDSKTTREASYNGWPDSSSHTPQELSDAGFFYAGFGDCVRCFYCGIVLGNWTREDNPCTEHARCSPNCVYLKQMKGETFVQQALQGL